VGGADLCDLDTLLSLLCDKLTHVLGIVAAQPEEQARRRTCSSLIVTLPYYATERME
jgi:hypothetical protein